MDTTKIEHFYTVLLESTTLIKNDLDSTFIEAFIETGENLIDDGTVHVENGLPKPETVKELQQLYHTVSLDSLTLAEKKKAVQLILINIVKEDELQANHQPTPDAIGVMLSYFIELFSDTSHPLRLADLSVGTGNLLFTLYTTLSAAQGNLSLIGVENDDLLISLASTLSALLKIPVELMHQDALQPLLVDPVDIMVSDLPVGYYPKEVNEESFQTSFKEGYSYSHFLLMEQGFRYLKDNGQAFYLLPTSTFESEEVKGLLNYVQSVGHVQGIVHLPSEWFKTDQSKKSVLIIQKKGDSSRQVSEVLIATAPSFNNEEAFQEFILDIKKWKKEQNI